MTATSNSVMQFSVFLKLTESEARALDALVGYGFDGFIKVFYEHMGTHYMKPHEEGLKLLFETIGKEIPKHLQRIDKTKEVFKTENPSQ